MMCFPLEKIVRYSEENPAYIARLFSRIAFREYCKAIADPIYKEYLKKEFLGAAEEFCSRNLFFEVFDVDLCEKDYLYARKYFIEGSKDIVNNHYDACLNLMKNISVLDDVDCESAQFLHSIPALNSLKEMLDKYSIESVY
jgi:hypothetical protein